MSNAIPPRIAALARETCEKVGVFVSGAFGVQPDEVAPHDEALCAVCHEIAAALLAQLEADCAAVLAKKGVGFPFSLALVATEAIRAAADTVAPDGEKEKK